MAQEEWIPTEEQLKALEKNMMRKILLLAADRLNDKVIPFFERHDVKLSRVLIDKGTEYCGNKEYP